MFFIKFYLITRKRGKKEWFLCKTDSGRQVWRKRGRDSVVSAIMFTDKQMNAKLKSLRAHGRKYFRYGSVFAYESNVPLELKIC